jgi:hypothetical protein
LRVEGGDTKFEGLIFRGGCTLVFDLSEKSTLTYAIVKNLTSERRLRLQLDYQLGPNNLNINNSSYMDSDNSFMPLNIQNLHDHG